MTAIASGPRIWKGVLRTSRIYRSTTICSRAMTKRINPGKTPKVRKTVNKEMENILKHLRLWSLLERWDDVIAEARKKRFSHERLLRYVLESECRAKSENARILRRRRARVPDPLEIETYPFQRQPKLNRKK